MAAATSLPSGVVLYELLTRRRLFLDRDLISSLRRVVRCEVPEIALFRDDLSPELERVFLKVLMRDRNDRFTDCSAFGEALNDCLDACGGRMDARRFSRWRQGVPDGEGKRFVPIAAGLDASSSRPSIADGVTTPLGRAEVVGASEDLSVAPRTRSIAVPIEVSQTQTNIEVPLDTFVGRTAEIQILRAALATNDRLITMLGAGGSGKTRLAVHFGAQSADRFMGGVWFCDLCEARDADDLIEAMGRSLNLEFGGSDNAAQLTRAMQGRGPALFIIDNVEQVASAAAELLSGWVREVPQGVFLVTSRIRLHLAGATVVAVDPLTLPDAMQLFIDRATLHTVEVPILPSLSYSPIVPVDIPLAAP